MTKPSRSRSQGRLARVGSSLRVDSARAWQKPPTAVGVCAISAPPATTASASPYWIVRMPMPSACVEVVQAVMTARFGPVMPYMIDRWPEIMLTMEAGM
jgi:hypothetical protein